MPGPAAPRRRLDTLNKSALPRVKPKQVPKPVAVANCCDDPKIEDDDGRKVCGNCYTLISESNIVADVTFAEDSRGAATVQGGFIGENARHARTLGAGAFRRVGGSERNTYAEIENNGRRVLNALCPSLNISEIVQNQAASIWGLAAKNNFNAGRKTDEVIAACLYAACRRQRRNDKMLIDISEKIHANVFRLGRVYKDLCETLFMGGDDLGTQYQVEIEPLIEKYCRQLEFGEATRQIAEDAIKIIRRMNRDWMTTGRHPAGLCGACIILAARMNNFRRSVREIVWVAKVADVTVAKRIEEFRRTKAAALTVGQFRAFGPRIKNQHDPPSYYEADMKKQKFDAKRRKIQQARNRGSEGESRHVSATQEAVGSAVPAGNIQQAPARQGSAQDAADTIAISDGESDSSDTASNTAASSPSATRRPELAPGHAQESRLDADGFAIPTPPNAKKDGVSEQTSGQKRKRGRPRKNESEAPPTYTAEELITEEELEREIEQTFEDNEIIREIAVELDQTTVEERARFLSDQQKKDEAARTAARRNAANYTWDATHPNHGRAEVTAEELASEFENDPEVNACILTDEEAKIKEQIWLTFNEDWLRQQHEKELQKRLDEARGGKDKRKKAAAGKKRKRARMGDGTLLTEAQTPVESPSDAAKLMLDKHAGSGFSKFVDYNAIKRIFGEGRPVAGRQERAGSTVPIAASQTEAGTSGLDDEAHIKDGDRVDRAVDDAPPPDTDQARAGADEREGDVVERSANGRRGSAAGAWDDNAASEDERYAAGQEDEDMGDEEDYDEAIDSMGRFAMPSENNYEDEFDTYGDDEEYE